MYKINTRGVTATIHENYNRGSGQLVNKAKSAVFFSPNCDQQCKEQVHGSLGITTEALGERYLGLPTAAEGNYVPARVRGGLGVDDQNWQTGLTGAHKRYDRLNLFQVRQSTDRSDRWV